jgi:hypothetical protein
MHHERDRKSRADTSEIAPTRVAVGRTQLMSGAADCTAGVLRTSALPVSERSVALTLSLVVVGGVGAALLSTPPSAHATALPVFVLGAGAMFGLGLADIAHGRELQFARALIIAGVLWSLSALAATPEPFANSVGHLSIWLVDLATAYLFLSYPSGRLEGRTERVLFTCTALLVGVLFLPTALLGPFPHPSIWSMCTAGCPHNVFSLRDTTPAIVQDGVLPLREGLVVLVFGATAAALLMRARRAGALLGQLYASDSHPGHPPSGHLCRVLPAAGGGSPFGRTDRRGLDLCSFASVCRGGLRFGAGVPARPHGKCPRADDSQPGRKPEHQ